MEIFIYIGIVLLIILLVGYVVLCAKMAKLAEQKGYEKVWIYGLCCFFYNAAGFIYVLAMPKKDELNLEVNSIENDIEDLDQIRIEDYLDTKEEDKVALEDIKKDNNIEMVAEKVEELISSELEELSDLKEELETVEDINKAYSKKKNSIVALVVITIIIVLIALSVIGIDILSHSQL